MNEVLKTIFNRRSVRKFRPEQIEDEELKMMCDLCHEGGLVLGPFLKPMTHLVHTE